MMNNLRQQRVARNGDKGKTTELLHPEHRENARAIVKRITRTVSIVTVEVCSAEMTIDRYCGERAYAPHASFSILFYRHLHKNKARFFRNADSSCVVSFR